MKTVICAATLLLLLCGCFKRIDHFSTLNDFRKNFSRTGKTSLQGKKSLSVSEARTIALRNNPTLLAAASAIHSAQYGYYRSLSAWSPEITAYNEVAHSISSGHDLLHPPAGIFPEESRFSTTTSLQATWLLFNGLARELDILIARLEYDRSIAASDDVKRLLLRALVYVWCDIQSASEEIIIYQADKAFQDAALTQAQEQFKYGHVPYSTVLNFQILSAKAQSKITQAIYKRQTACNALSALLGYDTGEFPADLNIDPLPAVPVELQHPLDFYLTQAIRNRPDLKAEKLQLEKALRHKQSAYAAFMPELHLFADFSFSNANAVYGDYTVRRSYYNHPAFAYGVNASWNLFKGFASFNELRRRNALKEIARWGLNKKFLDLSAEVNDALELCRNTLAQIVIYRNMENWVLEQRDLVYSEYINGRETIARLNQAQSELLEAQNSLILWQIQFQKATAQLNAALGKDAIPGH